MLMTHADLREGLLDARAQPVHGQGAPDHAGGTDEDLMRVAAEFRGQQTGHLTGVGHAFRTGAGIGIAAVDHHPAYPAAIFQYLTLDISREALNQYRQCR